MAIVSAAIHQHVLTIRTFAIMATVIQRDVLHIVLLSVQAVLMVSIWKIPFVTVVTISTVSVRQLLAVMNVFRDIMIQLHFVQSVPLENMDSLVNLIVYVLVMMEHAIKSLELV